jgi:hypothetical protein
LLGTGTDAAEADVAAHARTAREGLLAGLLDITIGENLHAADG